MNYTQLVAQLYSYCQQTESPQADFVTSIPTFISNAELRIYRELDFAADSGQNTSVSTAANNRLVDLTTMSGQTIDGTPVAFSYPVVVEDIAAKVAGTWVQFQLASLEFIDMIWPSSTLSAVPGSPFAYYTMLDNQTAVLAPTPDAIYQLRITGTWRPATMSASNATTWLGENVPDLFFCACMVEATGWMQNFGAQSDNPQMALSWEARYGEAKRTADAEEQRRKGQGPGWQPYSATPLAQPSR